jgi:uncharacterized SAM-dependent methyltransferase
MLTLKRFILNGLVHANEILGEQVFNLDDWKVIGEYVYDDQGGRHQAFYSPMRDVHVYDVHIKAGERVQIEQSLKYSLKQAQNLWQNSGLSEVRQWSALSEAYGKFALLLHFAFSCRGVWSHGSYKCEALVPRSRIMIPIA